MLLAVILLVTLLMIAVWKTETDVRTAKPLVTTRVEVAIVEIVVGRSITKLACNAAD